MAQAIAHAPGRSRVAITARLSRRARSTVLTVHTAGAAIWIGMMAALIVIGVAELREPISQLRVLDGQAGALIAWVLVPVVGLTVSSGLVLAVYTPWGLAGHWWVLLKMVIAAGLTTTGLTLMLIPGPVMQLRIGALGALLVATALSVFKPWGRTPFGARAQRRKARHRKPSDG